VRQTLYLSGGFVHRRKQLIQVDCGLVPGPESAADASGCPLKVMYLSLQNLNRAIDLEYHFHPAEEDEAVGAAFYAGSIEAALSEDYVKAQHSPVAVQRAKAEGDQLLPVKEEGQEVEEEEEETGGEAVPPPGDRSPERPEKASEGISKSGEKLVVTVFLLDLLMATDFRARPGTPVVRLENGGDSEVERLRQAVAAVRREAEYWRAVAEARCSPQEFT
jgi:hypothetical protein